MVLSYTRVQQASRVLQCILACTTCNSDARIATQHECHQLVGWSRITSHCGCIRIVGTSAIWQLDTTIVAILLVWHWSISCTILTASNTSTCCPTIIITYSPNQQTCSSTIELASTYQETSTILMEHSRAPRQWYTTREWAPSDPSRRWHSLWAYHQSLSALLRDCKWQLGKCCRYDARSEWHYKRTITHIETVSCYSTMNH